MDGFNTYMRRDAIRRSRYGYFPSLLTEDSDFQHKIFFFLRACSVGN